MQNVCVLIGLLNSRTQLTRHRLEYLALTGALLVSGWPTTDIYYLSVYCAISIMSIVSGVRQEHFICYVWAFVWIIDRTICVGLRGYYCTQCCKRRAIVSDELARFTECGRQAGLFVHYTCLGWPFWIIVVACRRVSLRSFVAASTKFCSATLTQKQMTANLLFKI